jgi:hypothetical protein
MIGDFILLLETMTGSLKHLLPYSLFLSLMVAVKLLLACKGSQ